MLSITQPAPWWRTAPNPPCVSWCEDVHDPDDFSRGGGFMCGKSIRTCDLFEVAAQAYTGVPAGDEPPGSVEHVATVWIDINHDKVEALSPEAARRFATDLALAISEAATVAERTVWA